MRLLSQSTRTTIRTLTLLFALTSLLLTMISPFVGTADADAGSTLTGSPFNGDDGVLDTNPGDHAVLTDMACGSGTDDFPFNGASTKFPVIHTDNPPTIDTGTLGTPKADLCNVWLNQRTVGDNIFLYLAWDRFGNDGTTVVFFEFHQEPLACTAVDTTCNPFSPRTDGDFVLMYDFEGNDARIYKREWSGGVNGSFGALEDLTANGFAEAEVEGEKPFFGEAVVNLADAGILNPVGDVCESFAGVIPGTFTGNSSGDVADYKDVILSPVQPGVSNCGTVVVAKVSTTGSFYGDSFDVSLTGDEGALDRTETLTEAAPSFTEPDVFAGSDYAVSEVVPDGWTIESISCDDETSLATGPGETQLTGITVEADETTTCTVTNSPDLPTITLEKEIVLDSGGDATDDNFQAHLDGSDVDWGVATTVDPGTYTPSETMLVDGYTQDSIVCDDADAGETATVDLGDDVTCVITNNDEPGALELIKVINDPENLYPAVTEDDFVPTVDGADSDWGTHTVDADTYTIGEHDAVGSSLLADGTFIQSSTVCDGQETTEVTVANGATSTCTITNTAVGAGLTVIKQVENNWGGTLQPIHFPLTVNGQQVDSGATATFPAGEYTIAETQQTGYELSDSFCTRDDEPVDGIDGESFDISVGAGETVICTFVNQDIPATVTLEKTVINDNGGLLEQGNFPSFLDGDPLAWDTTVNIVAGSHTASETPQEGYEPGDWGEDCAADGTFTAELATDYVCTITNDDVPGTLFINKEALNDDGGTTLASEFDVFLDGTGTPVTWTATSVDPGTGVSTAGTDALLVEANTPHTITEDVPSGYTMTSIECTNGDTGGTVTVENGETVECTVFNDDDPATLTISKEVINDDGGTATEDDFTPTVVYDGTGDASGVTDAPDWDSYTVPAGEYTIGELVAAGYLQEGVECDVDGEAVSGGETATFFLGNGETADCVVTNNDIGPGLTVVKQVTNDDGGTLGAGDFPLEVTGSDEQTTIVESGVSNDVDADTYTIGEQQQDGYELTGLSCVLVDGEEQVPVGELSEDGTTITVDLGLAQSIVCTVANDDIAPLVTLTKTVVNDDGGTLTADAFPVTFDEGPASWGEQFETTAGDHQAAEEQQPGYTSEGWGGDCATDGSLTTVPGGVYECTITNDDVPAGLTIVKEVVNDDEGTLGAEDFPLELTPEGGETEVVDSGAVTTVPAGTYTIGEQQQEDYELVSIVCDNGVEAAEGEDTVTVTVANGESVICTITNDDVPPVVIVGEILGTVEPVCDADAAYLNYEAFTQNVDGETVTIHWFDADGVEQHTDVVEGLSGRVLWPGAEVDEDGFATDWPGFVFDGEVWEQGDDGFGWANGAVTVTLEVNPTTDPLTATYPSDADAAAGEDCLPPEIEVAGQQFEKPAPAPTELPRTGLDTGRMALWAALLAGLGALILLTTSTPTATVHQRR